MFCYLNGGLDPNGCYSCSSSHTRQLWFSCDSELPCVAVAKSSSTWASLFRTRFVELLVLQQIATMLLAHENNAIEADCLLFSTFGSVQSFFDFILLRFRGFLSVIARDSMEHELVESVSVSLPLTKLSKEKLAMDTRGKRKCQKPKQGNSNLEPSKSGLLLEDSSTVQCFRSGSKLDRHAVNVVEETKSTNHSSKKDASSSNKDSRNNQKMATSGDHRTALSKKKSKRKGAACRHSSLNEGERAGKSTVVKNVSMPPFITVENEESELLNMGNNILQNVVPNDTKESLRLPANSVNLQPKNLGVSSKTVNGNALDHFSYSTCSSNTSDNDNSGGGQFKKQNPGKDVEMPSSIHPQSSDSFCDDTDCDAAGLNLMGTSDDIQFLVVRKLGPFVESDRSRDNSKKELGSRNLMPKESLKSMNSAVVQKVVLRTDQLCSSSSDKELDSSSSTSRGDPSLQPNLTDKFVKEGSNDSRFLSDSGNSGPYSPTIPIRGKSYEWPNLNSVHFSHLSSNNLPAATDRYHLDVTYNWHNSFHPSCYSGRHHIRTSCIDHVHGQMLPSLARPVSLDWPPMVRTRLTQSGGFGYDSVYNTRLQSSLCTGISNLGMQFRGTSGDNELQYAREVAGISDYKKIDFIEDSESNWLSEEEYDMHTTNGRDYNKFFGGGIMYWNPSDPVGTSFSRAPSHSSEDGSWAWYEADLNRAIDDMIDVPSFPPSYGTSGLASPTGGTFSSSFDAVGSGLQSHGHGYLIPGNDVNKKMFDSQCPMAEILEEKVAGSKITTSCTMEGLKGDLIPHPILRPIVIPSSSRKGSRSELKCNHNHVSPCLPSSRRDLPRIKRPPSPVVLCVPHSPRVPPPSSVSDSRKHRGFPVVRSGSSSPRNWGVRNWHQEECNPEDTPLCMDGPEVVWASWGKKGISSNSSMQPIPGSLLQDPLIAISQLARDQDHPDVAFPLQPSETVNCPSRKSSLSMMHSFLQEEINSFCKQVTNENQRKKPYVNWAVKRVAKSLQVLWPRSRTSIFGSNATGLALPTSDVDLVVCLPPVRNLEPIKEAGILEGRNGIKETCLQHAARYLANQEWVKSDSLKTIENTAIPLIMLVAEVPSDIITLTAIDSVVGSLEQVSAFMEISLDISFKSSSHTGLQTAALVRELTEQFPASVPLALVLKQFLADRSLDRSYSGGLSSYCLVLLITRFLQHEYHIGRSAHQNLGSLFMDFLFFFGNVFDPRQMRVSIQGSGLYMSRERGHSIDPIHIDDPLCPTNNVGRNCFRIHQCIKAFADAYSVLESELSLFPGDSGPIIAQSIKLLPKIIPSIGRHDQDPL